MIDPMMLVRYVLAGWVPGGRCTCVLCGHRVWRFMPYRGGSRAVPSLMRVLDIVGSGMDSFACPRCGAHDRERHLLLYMRAAGIFEWLPGSRVLHFAPERHLSQRIASTAPEKYVRCDLFPASVDVLKVDMEDIPFSDDVFDLVIANHVLEHVANERKALAEVVRVLAPGGYAILQTPYSAKLHRTWQDAGIDNDETRLQAHGQEDHVRLFGRDIFDRIASAGIESHVARHEDLLASVDSRKVGVNANEPFFLFRKPMQLPP